MKAYLLTTLVGASALALGCSHPTPAELKDARTAYHQAQQDPGAPLVPGDIMDAKHSLATAEKVYSDKGDSQVTRDYAYVAHRRAVSAKAKAETAIAIQQRRVAVTQLEQARRARMMAEAAAQSERQARVQRTEKNLVLTLSGSVLFAIGKSELLPAARDRLKDVADALKSDGRPISIIGHTDSTGSRQTNERLSLARADAVKAALVQQGVPGEKITTEGKADSDPVATNATPDGRANNRRVEIVLSGQPKQSPQQPMPTERRP